jgi:RNA polymerase sigma-70 factor (ECF subfamily)
VCEVTSNDPKLADPDVALMLRAKDGDLRGFEQLFSKHSKALVNFVKRFVPNAAVAEELSQEIFLKIYRARSAYEPRSRFKTFLYRIATNHCLNELRRGHYRERFESIDQGLETDDGRVRTEISDVRPGSQAVLEAAELSTAVEAAISALPETQRAALLLLRYQGLSYEEIAEALELSIPAVKSLLNRAKTALKERLAPYLGEDDELRVQRKA